LGPDSDVYLVKTDANGDTLWTRLYGVLAGEYRDEGWSVQQTTDGGYIISGETWRPGALSWQIDFYLIKTDANGDTTWTRTFDGFESTDVGRSAQQTLDGGYIIAGYTNDYPGNHDVFLVKTNTNGDKVWTKNLGRNIGSYPYDEGWSVQQTTDGGYIVVGFGWNYPVSDSDVYLIKLAHNPTQIETEVDNQPPQGFALYQNFPNPFNPTTTISYSIPLSSFASLKVYNALGKEVAVPANEEKPAGNFKVNFNAKDLTSGIYFYKLQAMPIGRQAGSFVETKKMLLFK
jgi:hypothetical protein